VEFLTAEFKGFKGEACENTRNCRTAVVSAGKATIIVLWEVKGVVPSDIISAVAVRSSEPYVM